MSVRALGGCGAGELSDVARGIVWAADNGARVINLSLGSTTDMLVVREAVQYALDRGVVLVAAAGNTNSSRPLFPASYPGVISVSALACNRARASYSNFGTTIFIAAPGGDNRVDCPGGLNPELVVSTGWQLSQPTVFTQVGLQGTSMAASHVAGVAALLAGRGVVGPMAVRQRLQETATDLGAPGRDDHFGHGLVNAAAAVGVNLPATGMRAFVGMLSGAQILRQSSFAAVSGVGAFTIPDAQSGLRTVFVWQDNNNNGRVDRDDYYARVDRVNIPPGGTISVGTVTVRRYTGTTLTPASP